MPLDTCIISATVYDNAGQPIPKARVTVLQTFKAGVLIMGGPIAYTADDNGEVELTVPRDSSATLRLPVEGSQSKDTVRIQIPDTETAALEELVSAANVPRQGLDVREAGVALPNKIGTLNFGDGFTIEETTPGVLTIEAAGGGSGGTPTIAKGADNVVGTGATISISGKDEAFEITLNTGTGMSVAGTMLTVTFSTPYASAPFEIFSASSQASADLVANAIGLYSTSTTSTVVLINRGGLLGESKTYKFKFQVKLY